MSARRRVKRFWALLCCLPLLWQLVVAPPAWAGPVDWHEVPVSAEGRQWWDAGSLRLSRNGHLTVLSRFQPPPLKLEANAPSGRPAPTQLYVMELDCDQELYRDISVNGLPRFRAPWQVASGDALSTATLRAACRAGADLLSASRVKAEGASDG